MAALSTVFFDQDQRAPTLEDEEISTMIAPDELSADAGSVIAACLAALAGVALLALLG
jgi:hypothetical protein